MYRVFLKSTPHNWGCIVGGRYKDPVPKKEIYCVFHEMPYIYVKLSNTPHVSPVLYFASHNDRIMTYRTNISQHTFITRCQQHCHGTVFVQMYCTTVHNFTVQPYATWHHTGFSFVETKPLLTSKHLPKGAYFYLTLYNRPW